MRIEVNGVRLFFDVEGAKLVPDGKVMRHPAHPGKLILSSTSAAMHRYVERSVQLFQDKGGPELGAMARHALGTGFDSNEFAMGWLKAAMPFYNTKPASDPDASSRTILNIAAMMYVLGPGGESSTFDFLTALANIQCPTLVLGGEEDPMTPIEAQADIAAAIPSQLVQFERVPNTGHGPYRDAPLVYDTMRKFILA